MPPYSRGLWQEDEHQRFLEALKRYPRGPWAEIAHCVGTRSPRQVQTHAQKYYEKIERHVRGLQRDRRGGLRLPSGERPLSRTSSGSVTTSREHEIDQEILEACSRALELGERLPTPARPRKTDPSTVGARRQNGEAGVPNNPARPGAGGADRDDAREREDEEDQEEEDDEEEEEEESEEPMGGELLPLDKSLDFLIELLAGLDDHPNAYYGPSAQSPPATASEGGVAITPSARFA